MATAPGIVTPEAVRLEFEGANLGTRIIALVLDLLVQFVLFLIITVAAVALSEGIGEALPDWVAIVLVLLASFGVLWGYPIGFETLWRGRTPGKAALGLRVVTTEGAPVRFRHAALRGVLGVVDFYISLGLVAVLTVLLSRRQQRLGDMVAGTLVLRERTAAARDVRAQRFEVPPGAEAYAATVDTAGMTADDYATVRGFLLRAATLEPGARARLGTDLARRLAAALAHVPPPGVSPELFLAVAAARYQERSGAPGGPARTWAPHAGPATLPGPAPAAPTPTPTPAPDPAPAEEARPAGGFAPPA